LRGDRESPNLLTEIEKIGRFLGTHVSGVA